jgi:FKBP-type peptidyl-prolyl cis-trans isomerase
MRRFLALFAIPLLACVVLAGCGSSSKSSSSPSSSSSASASASSTGPASVKGQGADASVTATGAFDKAPTVTIPKALPGNVLSVKTLVQGTGPALAKTDSLAANFVLYFWQGTSSSLKGNTFTATPVVIPSQSLPGLETALVGKKVGSRVLAVIPPAQGYGPSGNSQLGATGATTLVFVIDVLKQYSKTADITGTQTSSGGGNLPTVSAQTGSEPKLTFASSTPATPPTGLVTKTLLKGNAAKVTQGEMVVVQYVGYNWRTKKSFDSSWSHNSPLGFIIGASPEQVIPGWDKGLIGQTVGSRVMLSIPPADGYGSAGQSQAGIQGTDTLLFVVDIIDALKQG